MDMTTRKYFFDPHPGLAGCMEPIPTAVKMVADEVNGKTLPIEEVVALIQAACPDGDVKVSEEHEMVCLRSGDSFQVNGGTFRRNNWRVIRFRDAVN